MIGLFDRWLLGIIIFLLSVSKICAEETPLRNLYPIHKINQEKLTFGTYHVEGYVVGTYTCVPCAHETCRPCLPVHVIISEKKADFEEKKLTDQDLIVFVDDAAVFEKGKRYRFLIHVLDVNTMQQPANNIKLIYYEKLEQNKKGLHPKK